MKILQSWVFIVGASFFLLNSVVLIDHIFDCIFDQCTKIDIHIILLAATGFVIGGLMSLNEIYRYFKELKQSEC